MSDPTPTTWADLFDKLTTFVTLNILWVVISSLVITIPAATGGLFSCFVPMVRGDHVEPFRDFFDGMRQHWRKSTVLFLLDLGIIVLIAINFAIFNRMNMTTGPAFFSRSVTLFVALLALMVNMYLWPLIVTRDRSLRYLIKLSIQLVFSNPFWSFFVAILALVPLLLVMVLPSFVGLIFGFSSSALLASWGAWGIIQRL